MHKLHELGFDVNQILSGSGSAPVAPVARKDLEAMGKTNDCVLYGGRTEYFVSAEDSEIKRLIDEGMNEKEIRYYFHLMGIIEQERENFPKAIEYLEKASSLLPHQRDPLYDGQAPFIDSLAFAYYGAGNTEKAQEAYERVTSLTTGRIGDGDIYAKSFYMLGKIHEEQDNRAKAIEHYEKFLDLWKDADPGIAEMEDAKKRLAGLKGF